MEPWPCGRRRPIRFGDWSAPAHLSWVAGGGPVEPHTEVADHVRLYDDGNGRAGRARPLDQVCGGARRRAARGADAALRRGAVERLLRRWPAVRCCYEAGPTGFGLYRYLVERGID